MGHYGSICRYPYVPPSRTTPVHVTNEYELAMETCLKVMGYLKIGLNPCDNSGSNHESGVPRVQTEASWVQTEASSWLQTEASGLQTLTLRPQGLILASEASGSESGI